MNTDTVRPYAGQESHRIVLAGLERRLPLVEVKRGTWIASDAELILGDVAFLSKAAEALSVRIRPFDVDAVLTAEAKSIALSYELAKRLNLDRFVVARKSIKSYMGDHASQKLKSITTGPEQKLLLTKEEMNWLECRKVCLLDDVVSTGSTFRALERLAKRAGASVACKAAIWKEGPWYKGKDLLFLQTLPVFLRE